MLGLKLNYKKINSQIKKLKIENKKKELKRE